MAIFADVVKHTEKDAGAATPLVLITMLTDDSKSMSPYIDIVANGHNSVLDSLLTSKYPQRFLVHTRLLHGGMLAPDFYPPSIARRLSRDNYHLHGGTPLFDAAVDTFRFIPEQFKLYSERGYDVFTMTLIFTDGYDRGSEHSSSSVASVIAEMQPTEKHIVAGVGLHFPGVNFFQVFQSMGVPEQWIWTLTHAGEIDNMFKHFSDASELASEGPQAFEETRLFGFGDTQAKPGTGE